MTDVMLQIQRTLLEGAALVSGADVDVERILASGSGAFGAPHRADLPAGWVAIDYVITADDVWSYHGPVREEDETSITVDVYGVNVIFPKRLVVITRSERVS